MIYVFGIIAMLVVTFGSEGRGSWSKNIEIIGGLLWLASVIWAFFDLGLKGGFLFLIGTFVVGAILQAIFRPILNPRGR